MKTDYEIVTELVETENGVTAAQVAGALGLAGSAEATRWLEAFGFERRFNEWAGRGDWVWFPTEA